MDNFWSNYYSLYGFDNLNIFNDLEKVLNLGNDSTSFRLIKNLNKNRIAIEIMKKLENEDIFKNDIIIECLRHNCNSTKKYILKEGINYKKCRYNLSELIIVASEKKDNEIFNDLNNKKIRRVVETNRALYSFILKKDKLSAYYLIHHRIDYNKFENYLNNHKENITYHEKFILDLRNFYNKDIKDKD